MSAVMPLSATAPTPLSAEPVAPIARSLEGLCTADLWWLSGYAAGLARSRAADQPVAAQVLPEAVEQPTLTVIYGSQTGNSRRVAEALCEQLAAAGVAARLLRADAYPLRELKSERALAIVISTQGDGDPPDDARAFIEFLESKRAPALATLKFAVLGLGDSSYPQFCVIGQRLDARLEALGASRWLARADADVDIDCVAAPWSMQLVAQAKDTLKPRVSLASVTPLRPPAVVAWSRARPYAAEVLANQRISGRGAERDVRHIELALPAELDYLPGDALGVWPTNPPALVTAILEALQLSPDASVTQAEQTHPLGYWLRHKREITRLSRPFIAAQAERSADSTLQQLLHADQSDGLRALMAQLQLVDLLRAHPAIWSASELVVALRPLQPRLYSIASSRSVVGDEAHLTVAHVHYQHDGLTRVGAASHFLAGQEAGATVPVYVERNERFRLPAEASRDIIMIGPGTGVAPFRAFVQEREATAASGRQWLFFGNPHQRSDFLYQLEWQRALETGALQRLDLAFSRDQTDKVYVQHRLRERGREVYDWLERGAHLYVCGDATRMAKDVHATLIDIVVQHGGKSADAAGDYLGALLSAGRYARDVY